MRRPPSLWLFAAFAYCLAAMALAIGLSLQMPWFGLRLAAGPDADVVVESSRIDGIPEGARLIAIAAPGREAMALSAEDVLEEPDVLDTYPRLDGFFARQGELAQVLRGGAVTWRWQEAQGPVRETTVDPRARPISSLPFLFWFQLAVSTAGCLIACWVWVLRPSDWGARMFGLTGLAFPVFAMTAAVYGGRELALPAEWFRALSAANLWGSAQFGAALVGIFLAHPKPLVRPAHLAWPFVVFNLWWLADFLRLPADPNWGMRAVVMTEMLLAVALAAVQWRRNRGDALNRASLRWLSLSLLAGSGLFILLIIATAALGWLPPMPQGYAFGFFLFIYVGIALGLRRYRLFDLDEWAFRMLLWVGGAVAVVGVDALLIVMLDWSAGMALGASLWICGALYFPARQWLWQRLARRPATQVHEFMADVVRIAFQPSRSAQEALWDDLLRRIHDPMQLDASDFAGRRAELDDTGLTLDVPACGGMAARRLRYPARGQRLFSGKDADVANALCLLMDQAEAGRGAFERGANEERRRIARDMHDDVGARLLMLIHRAGTPELAELARTAMQDLRTALHVMDAHDMPLADAAADWRVEASARCEAAGVALAWTAPLLGDESAGGSSWLASRQKAVIERVLREYLTNALRHARPERVEVVIAVEGGVLTLTVRNDGEVGDPAVWQEGRGLRGMRQRLSPWDAELRIAALADGRAELTVRTPLGAALALDVELAEARA